MEARLYGAAIAVAAFCSLGAGYRTANFVVDAPTPQLAQEIGQSAEQLRRELAMEWLGKEMPQWAQPCMLTAQVAENLGAGGATSFVFEHGEVFGWRMNIQGSRERILDSVLPHEVTHTVFACHFRQALPRWADEGACTTVEHPSEKDKQKRMLITFLKTGRGISFSEMFAMKEYPADVLPLYSQGYSLARYLIARGGKRKFLNFVGDGLADENWPRAVRKFYGHDNLLALQTTWLNWVKQGSPQVAPDRTPAVLASTQSNVKQPRPASNLLYQQPPQAAPGASGPLAPVRPAGDSQAATPPGYQEAAQIAARSQPGAGPTHQNMARPQPPQAMQQRVLQWNQPMPTQPLYGASTWPGTVNR
jgi:hypothetical protein